jgi:peptidyl-dipeptidase A
MGTHEEESVAGFLRKHTAEMEPLHREAVLASWEFETTGRKEAMERTRELWEKCRAIYARADEYDLVRQIKAAQIGDPILRRVHKVLYDEYRGGQMTKEAIAAITAKETEISNVFNNFRAEFKGAKVADNTLVEVLRASNDKEERRAAWEASKQIGPVVAGDIRELARMRNSEAKRLGFKDFYTQQLELQEIDVDELFSLLGRLDEATRPLFADVKAGIDDDIARRCGLTDQERSLPWNYADPFFQGVPPGAADVDEYFGNKRLEELTAGFYGRIGLPIDDLLEKSDLYEKEGKCQHAFCSGIDRKGDVRVLCNLRPNARWMGTMLHEFGHAVYDKYLDRELPWILRTPSHALTTEGLANFMAALLKSEAWLTEYAGVPAEEARKIAAEAREEERRAKLIMTRWVLVMTAFERSFYADPEQDLNSLWWELVGRFQQVRKPEGRDMPDWAAKIHIAVAPAYYHSYLMGDLFASQLRHCLLAGVVDGPREMVTSPKLGEYLREKLFEPGNLHDWRKTVEVATGEPLNPAHFVSELKPA